MKRLTVMFFVLVSLLVGSSIFAIEKKETSRAVTPAPAGEKQKAGKQSEAPEKKGTVRGTPSKDYDDFIDKNNNGIDDRIEAQEQKPQKQPIKQKVPVDSLGAKPEAK